MKRLFLAEIKIKEVDWKKILSLTKKDQACWDLHHKKINANDVVVLAKR